MFQQLHCYSTPRVGWHSTYPRRQCPHCQQGVNQLQDPILTLWFLGPCLSRCLRSASLEANSEMRTPVPVITEGVFSGETLGREGAGLGSKGAGRMGSFSRRVTQLDLHRELCSMTCTTEVSLPDPEAKETEPLHPCSGQSSAWEPLWDRDRGVAVGNISDVPTWDNNSHWSMVL